MTVKERIIELAAEMFFRSGIKAITMDDISREAGVSKRTIYENFRDKDDLLRNCLRYIDDQFNKQHDQLMQDSANVIQMIFGLMKIGVNAIRQINPMFHDDLKRYHNRVWKDVYRLTLEKQETQTLTILKKGLNQGYFRKEIDIEILTVTLMHLLRFLSDKSIFPDHRFSQVDVFENVLFMFFRGIATPKGLEVIDRMLEDEADFFGRK